MQYYSDKKQKSTPFIIIIALCLLGVAITSFIAVSKRNNLTKDKEQSSQNSSIINSDPSYNDNTNIISDDKAQITENPVSDVPYEEPKTEKRTFVMPVSGNIIKGFSDSSLQYNKTYGDMRLHQAIDIGCNDNSQIVSVTKGTISDISETSDYGTIITIDHGDGLVVKYCGLGSTCVKKGESVSAGILIGTSKTPPCECMDESHIHIEVYQNDALVSPVSAFGFE